MSDPPDNVPAAPEGSPPPPRRRWLRRLAWGTLASAGLLIGLAIAARLYLSDARIRAIILEEAQARVPAPVELEAVEVSLLSGIEVLGLRIGPPEGFEHDVFSMQRFAIHWDLWDLVGLTVTVEEIALEGVRATVEENEAGRNVDVIRTALAPPKDEPEPPEEPKEDKPLEQPSLPITVDVREILMRDIAVAAIRPDMQVSVDRIGMEGKFFGEGQQLALELWFGLGARDEDGPPSTLEATIAGKSADESKGQADKKPIDAKVTQHFGVLVESTGLASTRVDVRMKAEAAVTQGERELPPITLSGLTTLSADLFAQRVAVEKLSWGIGEQTRFELQAIATDILSAPTVELAHLEARSQLDELAELVSAFAPDTEVSGAVKFWMDPVTIPVAALSDPTQVPVRMHATAASLGAGAPQGKAEDIDAKVDIDLEGGNASVHAAVTVAAAGAGPQRARGVDLDMRVVTPLAPWLPPPDGQPPTAADTAEPVLHAEVVLGVRSATAPAGSAGGLRMNVNADVPIAMAQKRPSKDPIRATVGMHLASGKSPTASASDLDLQMQVTAWDMAGKTADVDLQMHLAEAVAALGEESVRVPDIELATRAAARGATYRIGSFTFDAGGMLPVTMSGAITGANGPAPRFDAFRLRAGPIEPARLLALLPASKKPPMEVAGRASFEVDIDGTVEHVALAQAAQAPKVVVDANTPGSWANAVGAWVDFLQSWSTRFQEGLPFTARCAMALEDFDFADAKNEVRGMNMKGAMAMTEDGPAISGELSIAKVVRPNAVDEIAGSASVAFKDGTARSEMAGSIGRVEHPLLTRPLEGAAMKIALAHRIGGDIILEEMTLSAPDRGAELALKGLISKPLRVVMERGWEREGLPGVEANLTWRMAFASKELEPVMVGGPSVQGGVSLDGRLNVREGLLTLAGGFAADHVSLLSGEAVIEDMDGSLPFELSLAFDRRSETTPLRRDLPFAGGTVALLTSAEDIRQRPSRPIHYERLRPYRKRAGLTIRSIVQGPYEIFDFALDGRLERGKLLADNIAMRVLGGDVVGNMGIQIGRGGELIGDIAFKTSNIDASYFPKLEIEPGPQSELNADVSFSFLFGPAQRDLRMSMNITKIGDEAFVRFLELLDPEGKDEKMQKNKDYLELGIVNINEVAMWIRYENLNMDLDYDIKLGVPVPYWQPLPRELLRRYSLSGPLDVALQPKVDAVLGPALGWNRGS